MIKSGTTEDILLSDEVLLFAPEFLFAEFEYYEEVLLQKTHRTKDEFKRLLNIIKSKVATVPTGRTAHLIAEARHISPDPDDVEYLALSMLLGCALWSNDKALKRQDLVRTYTTTELISFLSSM